MITRVKTIEELKQIFVEVLLNKTNAVTKVSNESVLGGIAYGNAKIAQKALKDIAIVESHIFPDGAFGTHLDSVAEKYGISPRYGASQSSVYVRFVAEPGTVYPVGTVVSGGGQDFELESSVIVGAIGYEYGKLQSVANGSITNVSAGELTSITSPPTGHLYCTNEYQATGGRDIEQDTLFKLRIKQGANLAARNTLGFLTQVVMRQYSDTLRIFYQGANQNGQPIIAVATQNGIDILPVYIGILQSELTEYLNLSELSPWNALETQIEVKNIEYQELDVSFRCELTDDADPDDVRKDIQVAFSKEVDFRFWVPGESIVEWDNLLQIVKDHPKVRYVPDQFFTPNQDVEIDLDKLPRFRGFVMMDLEGNMIQDFTGVNPIYYPNNPDFAYQQTVLASIDQII